MRILNYPLESNTATLKDRYNNKRGEFALKKGENSLPLSLDCYYLDSFGNVFYVYEGQGVLEFEDALKRYDFSNLPFVYLHFFLSHYAFDEKTTKSEAKEILEFVEVYERNLQKGEEYLLPKGFKALDSKFAFKTPSE